MSESENPSTPGRIVKYSEEWWTSRSTEVRARRCKKGRGRPGEHCRKVAMEGQQVCGTHGGRAPQAKRKARQRLEEAADRLARQLLGIADSAESETVRLAAIRDALDRAGLKAPTSVDVSLSTPKPYEEMMESFTGMAHTTRSESRAARGIEEPTIHYSLPSSRGGVEVIDVEVTQDPGDNRPSFAVDGLPRPNRETGPEQPPQPSSDQTPGDRLMTIEEANELLAQQRRGRL